MAQNDHLTTDDERALSTLDVHYGMLLGCSPRDLRRPGWTFVTARTECDPMALLLGQRPVLQIVSRSLAAEPDAAGDPDLAEGRGGVAVIAPELRAPLAALLHQHAPRQLFTPEGLRTLDAHLRSVASDVVTPADVAQVRIRYVTAASHRPYHGQLQEWIEPLDELRETEPSALSLLAHYSGGVYVIRQRGTIAAYAAIRPQSPHVSEIAVRTGIEELRGHGLAQAVVSRATRAILAAGRLPLYRHHVTNHVSEQVARALGYRVYADAVSYAMPLA